MEAYLYWHDPCEDEEHQTWNRAAACLGLQIRQHVQHANKREQVRVEFPEDPPSFPCVDFGNILIFAILTRGYVLYIVKGVCALDQWAGRGARHGVKRETRQSMALFLPPYDVLSFLNQKQHILVTESLSRSLTLCHGLSPIRSWRIRRLFERWRVEPELPELLISANSFHQRSESRHGMLVSVTD
jgi:hypothetical protein